MKAPIMSILMKILEMKKILEKGIVMIIPTPGINLLIKTIIVIEIGLVIETGHIIIAIIPRVIDRGLGIGMVIIIVMIIVRIVMISRETNYIFPKVIHQGVEIDHHQKAV